MSRGLALLIQITTALLTGGGLVWGWLRVFGEPSDEFSAYAHPSEPWLRDSHVLLAPLVLFLIGLVWRSHVWGRIQAGVVERRRTGIALMVLLPPLSLSGYGLQVAAEETWRGVWLWMHLTTGVLFALLWVLHQFGPRLVQRNGSQA